MANVTEIPTNSPDLNAAIPSEFAQQDAEVSKSGGAEARKRGRPPGIPQKGVASPNPPFFDRVAAVPKEDWGTRAFMYVYASEPILQQNTFGKFRYMLKASAPVDLEKLKQDYGSFKGWMTLNLRKTGTEQSSEVDRYDFEIYDPLHPPKIPRSSWANDQRNKRWLDLLPPEKPSASEAAGTMLEAMKVYKEIREDVKQEVGPPPAEPSTRPNEVIETMRAAKELFAQPNGQPAEKPENQLQLAINIAQTMMQMRSENPMVDILRDELNALRAELAAERQATRKQEQQQAPKSLLEQFKELAALKDMLKDVIGGGAEAAGTVVKAGKTTWLDLVQNVVPQIINSEFLAGIGQRIAAGAQQAAPNPALSQQRAPAASPADTNEAAFQRWIGQVVNKQVIRYFLHMRLNGDDLADLLYAMEPEWTVRLQNFEHPQLPGMKGKPAILAAYRVTPSVWPQIEQSGRAQEFEQFVEAFCNWKPEADDSTASPEDNDGVIDLTTSTIGRGPDGEQTEATEA